MTEFDSDEGQGVTRRDFLKIGAGAAAGIMLPSLWAPAALAAEKHQALGTYPAGVGRHSVFVGITVPLTGSYSASGKDLRRGYELAIEQINAGHDIARRWGMHGKGVLGKQIEYDVADSQTKPNPAVQAQTKFINQKKALMITGSVSSATAIALEKLAQREHVLNMVGASGSNDTTGKDCQRYGFRSQPPAYMVAQGLAPVLAKEMGKQVKAAYLVPDYTYGHSVFDSVSKATEALGWKTVSKQLVPLGTTDFSSALINIANSGADVFVNVAFGNDAVASSKQAQQFGILKKMKLVVPNISPFQYKEAGSDIMEGAYGTMDFWWGLEDRYPLAKDFVQAFEAKHNYKPRWTANIGYMQTYIWALAVQRAGTFYPVSVIKELESGHKVDSTLGEVWYSDYDHQLVRPVPVVRGKSSAQMKGKEDYYEVVGVVSGEKAMVPKGTFGCELGPYT
ncbi:MAG TPA: ABC transporter substrate-binding protein [Gammaproteobacteria bacterium]|nr:ABC transporter substrate-binding protein [Gammaproteobacteria bacterium]